MSTSSWDLDEPFSGPVDRETIVSRITSHPIEGTPEVQRQAFAELALGRTEDSAEAPVRIDGRGGTIVYFHGGGYVFGSPETHARIGRGLAQRTGLDVILPAYPLAPEHMWPEQLDAAMTAVGNVVAPVILAGDSAGGHLALVTALELGRRGASPAGLVLFSPNTDRTGLSTTRERNDPLDPMVDDQGDKDSARSCFGDLPADDVHVSPVLDDLTLLPPLYVEVGNDEVLLGDSLLLAQRAREQGCTVTLHVQADGLHMMQLWAPWWGVAAASLDRAATFIRAATRKIEQEQT